MAEIKIRINQISKKTGFSNNELVEKAQKLKMDVKSHSSSITEKEEDKLVKAMGVKKAPAKAKASTKKTPAKKETAKKTSTKKN
jgi:glucan-binding YG repeat protein